MHQPHRQYSAVILYLSLALLSGCSSYEGSIKPAESQDENSGMTVGSLEKPLLLVQNGQSALTPESHVSSAYLGPVEWDNMGAISLALWVHLVPANDWQFDDIKAPGAVALALDGAGHALKLAQPPAATRGPYRPIASWGQTAYFELDVDTLRRMAASHDIELIFKAAGGTPVRFAAAPDAHETLERFLHARGY
jgi:hypothetical protein